MHGRRIRIARRAPNPRFRLLPWPFATSFRDSRFSGKIEISSCSNRFRSLLRIELERAAEESKKPKPRVCQHTSRHRASRVFLSSFTSRSITLKHTLQIDLCSSSVNFGKSVRSLKPWATGNNPQRACRFELYLFRWIFWPVTISMFSSLV
jgi:hypothetical protein